MQVTRFVQGSIWMVGMRWAIRCAGLVSTVILARILTPADFGIVAMSSLVYGLLLICSEMGTSQLLLRTRDTDRQAYDTAWTIGLIQSIVLALAMALAAYPAASYFKEPRLVDVIHVVAAGSILNGLVNIGIVMFRRDLDFRRDFLFGFYGKVVTVIPVIVLALVYPNYWAIVVGQIIGHAIEVAISYAMHSFRPRLSLLGWRRFVSFSLWITPSSIADFLSRKADVFIVGYLANAAQLGAYNVASELSRMATAEVVIPMARALYPNYAKLRNDLKELSAAFLIVVRTVCIVSFSFGFGIAAVSEDIVHVVLGDQWGFAAPLVMWLGICGAFAAILFTLSGHILVVLDRERSMFVVSWAKLTVFGASVLVAAQTGDPVNIAMAAALSIAAFTIGYVFYLPRLIPVSATRVLMEILRVLLAGLVMFGVVRLVHSGSGLSHFINLLLEVSVGAAVFVSILYVAWLGAGKPDGPERRVLQLLSTALRKRASQA
jgi:lipopolysaccharide exporter